MRELRARMTRLGLDDHGAAVYLGVSVSTYRKWVYGDRDPNDATKRLFEVLELVEKYSPALHESLIKEAK